MAWIRMLFKDKKVYVKCDEAGQMVLSQGIAEFIYSPGSDKIYKSHSAQIRPIAEPDIKEPVSQKRDKTAEVTPKGKVKALKKDSPAIEIFTDGACFNNPGPAGCGIILKYKNQRREKTYFLKNATNNIAELTAIKIALESIKDKSKRVIIYSDSQYCIGVLTQNWKPKLNQVLITEIKSALLKFDHIEFKKVEAHAGIKENERADFLAKSAINKGLS